MKRFEYNTDGADIYRNSFAIIREESDLSRFDADEETVAVRMIHAAGQTDLAKDRLFHGSCARSSPGSRGRRSYLHRCQHDRLGYYPQALTC